MRLPKSMTVAVSLLTLLFLLAGCSPPGIDSSGGGGFVPGATTTPSAMLVTATSTNLNTSQPSTISAYVVDNIGNPISGATVSFSLDSGLKGSLTSATAVTAANGIATVTFTAGTMTTVATVIGSIGSVTGSVQITITGTGGSITVAANPLAIVVGNTSTVTATVRDGSNNPIANTVVTFTLNNTSANFAGNATTTATTNASGVATVALSGASVGSVTVTAQALGLSGTVNVTISSSTGASIIVTAAPTSILTNGTSTITVVLTDSTGSADPNEWISFSLNNPSAATLSASTAQTNASGIATVTLTAGALPASVTITGSFSTLSSSTTVAITTPPPANVTMQTNPPSILVLGTSTVTATVTDINNNPVPDGTVVNFVLTDSTLGSLSNTVATTSSSNGTATATFIASNKAGTETVTATAGGISQSATINVVPASTGSIQFISATPQAVGIQGSGQPETSAILFNVKDINGNPVADGTTVTFSMNGPGGGAYITGSVVGASVATSSTVNGNAMVTLHSGTTAGPVTITATTYVNTDPLNVRTALSAAIGATDDPIPVDDTSNFPLSGTIRIDNELIAYTGNTGTSFTGCTRGAVSTLATTHVDNAFVYGQTPISSQATAISIGGGVPSAGHWNLSTSQFNLAGLKYSGLTATISGYIADRFGNYNILNGTAVNFYAEAGAIAVQGITDSTGMTSVTFRTQYPYPADVQNTTVANQYFSGAEPWRVGQTYNYNPRDGWATILATTMGEEAFLDENGDGLFTTVYSTGACPLGYSCECHNSTTDAYINTISVGNTCASGSRSEAFIDIGEPFYDVNDNGTRDNGSVAGSPYEQYIDANSNGAYNSPNSYWDGPGCTSTYGTTACLTSKMIWKDIRLEFTGDYYFWPLPDGTECYSTAAQAPGVCTATYAAGSSSFAVAPTSIVKGGSGAFCVIVGDMNLNSMPGGTVISASASPGTVAVPSSVTLLDGLSTGPTEFCFSVSIAATETASSTVVSVIVGSSGLPATITVPLTLPPAPAAPTGVSATSLGAGTNTIRVDWNTVSGASSYNIYWRTLPGVTKLNGTKITGVAPAYDHTGLTPGTTYYYVVSSVGTGGEGNISSEVSATVPPAAPTGVSAIAGIPAGEIDISWSPSAGATSYNIYWSTSPGVTIATGTQIASVTSPYAHTGLTTSTTYYYVVTAVRSAAESSESTEVSATAP